MAHNSTPLALGRASVAQAIALDSLHNELLEDIFELIAYRRVDVEWIRCSRDVPRYYSPRDLTALQLVCSRWKRVVQGHQQLWAGLALDFISTAYLRRALTLSGTAPLTIIAGSQDFEVEERRTVVSNEIQVADLLVDLLFNEASRVSVLYLGDTMPMLYRSKCLESPHLTCPGTPQLRSLHLIQNPHEGHTFWDAFVAKAPRLATLSIPPPYRPECRPSLIHTTPFTNLEFLLLGAPLMAVPTSSPRPLLTLLRRLPMLKTLVLLSLQFDHDLHAESCVSLPHLRTLVCEHLGPVEMTLPQRLDCPALSVFALTGVLRLKLDPKAGQAGFVATLRHIAKQLRPDAFPHHLCLTITDVSTLLIRGWRDSPYTSENHCLQLELPQCEDAVHAAELARAVRTHLPLAGVRGLTIENKACGALGTLPAAALVPLARGLTGVKRLHVEGVLSAETWGEITRMLGGGSGSKEDAPALPVLSHASFALDEVCPHSPRPPHYVKDLCHVLRARRSAGRRTLDKLSLHFRREDARPDPDAWKALTLLVRKHMVQTHICVPSFMRSHQYCQSYKALMSPR